MSIVLQPIDFRLKGWSVTGVDTEVANDGFGSGDGKLATPIAALTAATIDGKGAFDVLMQSTKQHLQEEYDAGRITGKEYSTVYLGALTAVLGTAVQFLLNEQQVNLINAEIGLTRQKIVTELAQTDDNIPVGLGFNYVPSDFYETRSVEPVTCPVSYTSTYSSSFVI